MIEGLEEEDGGGGFRGVEGNWKKSLEGVEKMG